MQPATWTVAERNVSAPRDAKRSRFPHGMAVALCPSDAAVEAAGANPRGQNMSRTSFVASSMRALRMVVPCAAIALACAAAACSSSSTAPPAQSDAGSDAAITTDASSDARPQGDGGDAGRVCSTLPLPSVSRGVITMDDTLGEGKGGTIVDGTYELDRVAHYTENSDAGAPSGRFKWVLKITGNKYEGVLQIGDNPPEAQSGTFTTSDTNKITFVTTCPDPDTENLSYGVNEPDGGGLGDTEIIIHDVDRGLQYAFTKK
jgi:hypothetical protein